MESSGVRLSYLSDRYPIFSHVKSVRASTVNQYVDFKYRLKNSVCYEKFKDLIKPILDWYVNETSYVQTLYDNFTNLVTNSYDSDYPMIEVRKKA